MADTLFAQMAELVYAFDLKSNGEIRAGSIPALGTKEASGQPLSFLLYLIHNEYSILRRSGN